MDARRSNHPLTTRAERSSMIAAPTSHQAMITTRMAERNVWKLHKAILPSRRDLVVSRLRNFQHQWRNRIGRWSLRLVV